MDKLLACRRQMFNYIFLSINYDKICNIVLFVERPVGSYANHHVLKLLLTILEIFRAHLLPLI